MMGYGVRSADLSRSQGYVSWGVNVMNWNASTGDAKIKIASTLSSSGGSGRGCLTLAVMRSVVDSAASLTLTKYEQASDRVAETLEEQEARTLLVSELRDVINKISPGFIQNTWPQVVKEFDKQRPSIERIFGSSNPHSHLYGNQLHMASTNKRRRVDMSDSTESLRVAGMVHNHSDTALTQEYRSVVRQAILSIVDTGSNKRTEYSNCVRYFKIGDNTVEMFALSNGNKYVGLTTGTEIEVNYASNGTYEMKASFRNEKTGDYDYRPNTAVIEKDMPEKVTSLGHVPTPMRGTASIGKIQLSHDELMQHEQYFMPLFFNDMVLPALIAATRSTRVAYSVVEDVQKIITGAHPHFMSTATSSVLVALDEAVSTKLTSEPKDEFVRLHPVDASEDVIPDGIVDFDDPMCWCIGLTPTVLTDANEAAQMLMRRLHADGTQSI